jgi:diacylglycerol kinase (ATP)
MVKLNIAFIVNPFSGSVKKRNIPEAIELFLDHSKYNYTIHYTEYSGHATDIARMLSEKAVDVIVAVGGDGSIHEIGNGLTNPNISLAILPIGSGNGLATHLGYKPRNLRYAFDIINQGHKIKIDAGAINGKKFFSVFGVGLDANIAYDYKTRRHRNFFAYAFLVIKQSLFNLQFFDIEFHIKGAWRKEKILIISGFNSDQFGYNFGIVPWASAQDGQLDICILKKFNRMKLLWVTICLLLKKPHWIEEMELIATDEMIIKKNNAIKFQMDGDPFELQEDLHISMMKQSFPVLVPKN